MLLKDLFSMLAVSSVANSSHVRGGKSRDWRQGKRMIKLPTYAPPSNPPRVDPSAGSAMRSEK